MAAELFDEPTDMGTGAQELVYEAGPPNNDGNSNHKREYCEEPSEEVSGNSGPRCGE